MMRILGNFETRVGGRIAVRMSGMGRCEYAVPGRKIRDQFLGKLKLHDFD